MIIFRRKTMLRFLPRLVFVLVVISLGILLDNGAAHASSERLLPFSAPLHSAATNLPVPDGNYTLTFRIYSVATDGTALWSETQTLAVTNGLVVADLGSVTPFPDSFNFSDGPYYLGITVGSDDEMTPRKRIGEVPMAFNADTLGGLTVGSSANNIVQLDQNGWLTLSGGAAIGNNLTVAGNVTSTGEITVQSGGAQITGNSVLNGSLTGLTGLSVTSGGASIAAGGLTVVGATGLTGNLSVTGTASLSGDNRPGWRTVRHRPGLATGARSAVDLFANG
ncbi:hypothetical protein KGQ71_04155 [Patescibacteria group bacterium]|nr:hypothetical protein [Patescibacteria group bacterium]